MPPPPDGKDKGEAGESPALTRNCNWVTPEARTTAQSRMCPLAMMGKYSVYIVNLALRARFFCLIAPLQNHCWGRRFLLARRQEQRNEEKHTYLIHIFASAGHAIRLFKFRKG